MEQVLESKNGSMTAVEAHKLIEHEKLQRSDQCRKDIQEVLKKYNCAMEISPQIVVIPR